MSSLSPTPKPCTVDPIPRTLFPCADWALLPQMLVPNVYGTCAPKNAIKEEDLYPRDTSFVSFLNLNSLCIETRSDIYDAIRSFTPELYVDLNLENIHVEKQPPPTPSPLLKAVLLKLVDKCTAVEPILNALDALIRAKEEFLEGETGSGSGSCSGLENQWYIVTDLPESEKDVCESIEYVDSLLETSEASLSFKEKETYCTVPRKTYTNCVNPPLKEEPKDKKHKLGKINETFLGLKLDNENSLLDSLKNIVCQNLSCNVNNISCFETGSGSGSGSDSDLDKIQYCKAAVFMVSSYLQNKIWTLLLEYLTSSSSSSSTTLECCGTSSSGSNYGCSPWTALQFEYFNPNPIQGSGSGSGCPDFATDQFLGRLDYANVLTYSQLQYETIGANFCIKNTNIFPKTAAYGQGATTCSPFPLPIQACAPLNTFIAPAVESNPVLDFFPPKFWTQLKEISNGIINAYNYADNTEFVASEIEFFYPMTPLPFTIRLKATLWLPRPMGFTSVGFNSQSIQNNFGEYIDKIVNVNYTVSQKACLQEIVL